MPEYYLSHFDSPIKIEGEGFFFSPIDFIASKSKNSRMEDKK